MATAYRQGYEAVCTLERTTLFLWLAKIFYGIMYLELRLLQDRPDPQSGSILPPEFVQQYRMHHMLLQAGRGIVRWEQGSFPASMYFFRCQVVDEQRLNFDYRDHLIKPFFSIRFGEVGIVAALQDWSAMEETLTIPKFDLAHSLPLHPRQFSEVVAIGLHAYLKFNRIPTHLVESHPDHLLIRTAPLGGMVGGELFNPFDADEFAQLLAHCWQVPIEQIYDGKAWVSLLVHPDGTPHHIPFNLDQQVEPRRPVESQN